MKSKCAQNSKKVGSALRVWMLIRMVGAVNHLPRPDLIEVVNKFPPPGFS
jgi:hypothetical protein